jgi:hypothetical protein
VDDLERQLAEAALADDGPALRIVVARSGTSDGLGAVRRSAAGPLAHLLCRAAVRDEPGPLVDAVITGLAEQRSLLALTDAVDELLASESFVRAHGASLQDSLLAGERATRQTHPLVAAGFLEGALRVAITEAGNPLTVLATLAADDPMSVEPGYAERLPRLIGVALDHWSGQSVVADRLRQTLRALRAVPSAAADAAFECGIESLRRAAAASTSDASALLFAARREFASAESAEEARDDAALYGAGVDALVAFTRHDSDALVSARIAVGRLLERRERLLHGTHQPQWRRGRRRAELAWQRFGLILDKATGRLQEPAWLSVWEALDDILDAYALDRAVDPVPGHAGGTGFPTLIRPVVEGSIARERVLLALLRRAAEAARCSPKPVAQLPRLQALLDRIDALAGAGRNDSLDAGTARSRDAGTAAGSQRQARERLVTMAPTLLASLGEHQAGRLAAALDDDLLRLVEGVAYTEAVARSLAGDPTVDAILDQLTERLTGCRDYIGQTRRCFDLLLREMVLFLTVRHDVQRSRTLEYLKPFTTRPPKEALLQDDFANWLRTGHLAGRIDLEVPNVATGRVDVKVSFGSTRFFVEVKRELRDASPAALERSYAPQAADYSGTSATLGLLLVLDLTKHRDGVRHVSECAWVTTKRPAGSEVDRYLVVGVVVGNRSTPSAYSS